jgi:hypothetical protein
MLFFIPFLLSFLSCDMEKQDQKYDGAAGKKKAITAVCYRRGAFSHLVLPAYPLKHDFRQGTFPGQQHYSS